MTRYDHIKNERTTFFSRDLSSANLKSALNYAENVQNNAPRGHGFAAERANHHIDQLLGRRPEMVGTDNAKNGADRLVNGVQIQSKYCATGARCISECFDGNGKFRYMSNGKPMQIEVPKDLYESAVQSMGDRIRNGQVPGVTDPAEASNLVRKGHVTYKQALRIAKVGSIEGLTFDAVRGIQLAGSAAGISAVFSFVNSKRNGEDQETALKNATQTGLQVGGVAWVTSILTAQVGRTGLEKGLRSSTDFAVRQLAPKTTHFLASGLRGGKPIYGVAATSHLSKVLRGNIVTTGVTVLVITGVDAVKMMRGQLTGAQLMKNSVVTVGSTAAGTAAALWVAPLAIASGPLGWLALAVVGTVAGGIAGKASKVAMDQMIRDDGQKLQEILEAVVGEETENFFLNEKEFKDVIARIPDRIKDHTRDILTANDPKKHALEAVILPLIEEIVAKRPRIKLPDDATFLAAVEANIADVADEADEVEMPETPLNTTATMQRFLSPGSRFRITVTSVFWLTRTMNGRGAGRTRLKSGHGLRVRRSAAFGKPWRSVSARLGGRQS